ncbi:molybdate ABC transporter permease subunit [Fimbriimonas ginsengisoli]|uniref:Molybdenum transport system permease protein ModB n=1 Tax=Fimbriimonas ginsengisoli Gsoil 348 TaxID=661478 RepID=A0A068NJ69_FIMGI|nr:ABC transporter permease subunit [Fimbriimonas ginsengisoli]AIE83643.1 Molybdenum transport system permease protein ModB [Fimbriimonas ginsengisoli Gsoil 348]
MGELAPKNRVSIASWAFTGGALLLGAPLLLLVVLSVAALVLGTSPSEVAAQLHEETARQAILLSLKTTLISLALVVVFGTGLAVAIHRAPPWLAGILEIIVTLPAIMPPSVAGIALLLAFGRQGLLGSHFDALGIRIAFTPIAVVMAQAFVATPFFVRELANGLQATHPALLEAARIDGAGNLRAATSILLPISSPFLLGGAALAWARAVGEFGATILFAGNLAGVTQTMPLAIYLGFETNLSQAKALALLLLGFAVCVLVLMKVVFRRHLALAH